MMKKPVTLLALLLILTGCTHRMNLEQGAASQPAPAAAWNEGAAAGIPELEAEQVNGEHNGNGLRNPDQRLLDSAMDFYQTANEFWEQGDLENALDALDKAYSLILEVGQEVDQTIQQQKEDMRVTIARRIMEVYASRFNVVNGHSNAIPMTINSHVENAIKLFSGKEKKFFIESYVRSGKYRPAILKALREEGLPEELSWLPLIESGFKVRAYSRARALGMWQFIASTGYKFGLQRNSWIDERMDPEKSTLAAIAYLKELHGLFGDWTTALAGYNCGEGNVLKVIRRQKIRYLDNFWDLYKRLPRETASYVPRFLAVLHIINDPAKYGIKLPPLAPEEPFEVVTINKQVHLKTIAKNIGLPYTTVKDMNPELRNNVTPTNPYSLKVPPGKAESLLAKLKDIPIYVPPVPPYVVHRVRNGESLSVIAEKYRTSVRAIMAMNGIKRSNFIRAGGRLKIPTSRRSSYRSVRPASQSVKLKGNLLEYVVQKGDSLWEIANRFSTTTKAILALNQMKKTQLTAGQVLMLPKPRDFSLDTTKPYKVREGDSPYLIAKRHQMNLAEFLRINNLTPRSMIFPGQQVVVRAN
ncbi:LysM peptidoglycan-binding domain-containing protein [Thermodesulfobacteriota bacterium]